MTPDPLAGQRANINDGDTTHLIWPDTGQGCPVKLGELYTLRTCTIEITRTQRTRRAGQWVWIAWFARIYGERGPYLLGKRGGYTENADQAMSAQDDPKAATLDQVAPEDRSAAHRDAGEPPEPEGIPPHEIAQLPTSVAAKARFSKLRHREEQERRIRQLSGRIKSLQTRADRAGGLDLTDELDELEATLARVENTVVEAA